ncbi:MAG: hypothetical protein EXS68_01550 [Candidatus Ryanbacteria bacterium]|nr:hypothetical protein [Candidatus Ryanbacteria bacterium]
MSKSRIHRLIASQIRIISALFIVFFGIYLIYAFFENTHFVGELASAVKPKVAKATYQFSPVAGSIVRGSATTTVSALAASANSHRNMGGWQGTLADDNLDWVVASTASGVDVNLTVGGVQLNGANILMIQTEIDEDATSPALYFEICDWTSSTGVNHVADAACTGGGWRILNANMTTVAPTTRTAYHYQIYDGFWAQGSAGGTTLSTPLSNFVNGSNQIKIRYYSTTNTTRDLAIDYLRVYAMIHPLYSAGGFANLGSGTPTGSYASTTIAGGGQTGTDTIYLAVPGTAGSVFDFHLDFKNVETFTGANTIMIRATYDCSGTGPTHRPKIYNFNSSAWEDLSTASIACSATDATDIYAKNNVTLSNYISGGTVRIGWRGLSNSTVSFRIDSIYMMIGATNTNTGECEISFGSVSAGTCSNTRDIDTDGSASTWNILTEDESNSFGHAYYALDNDADATVEEAAASHVGVSVTVPTNASVVGVMFAARYMSGVAGTVVGGIKDYSGFTGTTGGWTPVTGNSTTALTYADNITTTGVASGGVAGFITNPEDHIDTVNNEMYFRVRTSASGSTASNSVNQVDFVMLTISWVEPPGSLTFTVDSSSAAFGTLSPGTLVSSSNTLTTFTNNSTGLIITVERDDTDSTMDLTTDAATNISDKTNWDATANTNAGNATASTTESQTLQFRIRSSGTDSGNYSSTWWGSNDKTANAKFAGFPLSSASTNIKTIINRTSASSPETDSVVLYNLDVPPGQKTGSYSGGITYTATVNP